MFFYKKLEMNLKKPLLRVKNSINGIKNKKSALLFTLIIGVVAGFINGILGAGGGIVALVAIQRLLGSSDDEKHDAFANALFIMLVLSAVSLLTYIKGEKLIGTGSLVSALIIPAILGGAVGAYLQNRFDIKLLKFIFSVIIIYSGIRMIVN